MYRQFFGSVFFKENWGNCSRQHLPRGNYKFKLKMLPGLAAVAPLLRAACRTACRVPCKRSFRQNLNNALFISLSLLALHIQASHYWPSVQWIHLIGSSSAQGSVIQKGFSWDVIIMSLGSVQTALQTSDTICSEWYFIIIMQRYHCSTFRRNQWYTLLL